MYFQPLLGLKVIDKTDFEDNWMKKKSIQFLTKKETFYHYLYVFIEVNSEKKILLVSEQSQLHEARRQIVICYFSFDFLA